MVLILSVGCPRPIPVEALPTGTPLAIDDERAVRAVAGQLARVGRSGALRGSARVLLEGPDFKLNRPQRIAIARPGRLRFEVLGLFDTLVAMLVTDGRVFGFFDAASGEITRGIMTSELLWDLAKLDLDPDEVVDLLLAAPTPSRDLIPAGVWLEPDGGLTLAYAMLDEESEALCHAGGRSNPGEESEDRCRASSEDLAAGGEIFRFDAEGLLREMRSIEPGWETRFLAFFDEYEDLAEVGLEERYPMRITVRSPRLDSMARFEWKRVMLSQELPDRLFRIVETAGSGG
jgi:hypothetical protein